MKTIKKLYSGYQNLTWNPGMRAVQYMIKGAKSGGRTFVIGGKFLTAIGELWEAQYEILSAPGAKEEIIEHNNALLDVRTKEQFVAWMLSAPVMVPKEAQEKFAQAVLEALS